MWTYCEVDEMIQQVCDGSVGKERGEGRSCVYLFQAEDGIRDLVRSRGLGDVYKRQGSTSLAPTSSIWLW